MAPEEGFEPPTRRLTAACSTTELLRKGPGPRANLEPVDLHQRAAGVKGRRGGFRREFGWLPRQAAGGGSDAASGVDRTLT